MDCQINPDQPGSRYGKKSSTFFTPSAVSIICLSFSFTRKSPSSSISSFIRMSNLGKFSVGTSSFHLTCQDITGTVKFCGLIALSGNDQAEFSPHRSVQSQPHPQWHNAEIPLNQILLINHHVYLSDNQIQVRYW